MAGRYKKLTGYSTVSGEEKAQDILNWVINHTGYGIVSPFSAIVYVDETKEIQGAAIFDNYIGTNIFLHIHGPGCINRRTIKDTFGYVFLQLKCLRLTAIIREKDTLISSMAQRTGFELEARLKDFYGIDNDGLVYKITLEKAKKWLLNNAFCAKAAASSRP